MGQPLVSVVIPVFNGMPYLEDAVASVRNQTYPNIELCLVDGGSTDASGQVVARLAEDGARVATLEPGTPAATTWTRATELATGDFIKLLCQDDLLYPDAISRQVDDLTHHPECALAVAQRDIISASGKVLTRRRGLSGLPAGVSSGQAALRAAYLSGTNILGEPHTILFRRDALLSAMPWRGERPYLLDIDSYAVVLEESDCRLFARKESVGAFRVSTSSWSTRLTASQKAQLREWQQEYEDRHQPSSGTRRRAAVGLNAHNVARRLAYAWLYVKGDME